jgi:hypothetical protein
MSNNKINYHETINEETSFVDDNEDLNNEILNDYYNNVYEDDISFEKLMTNNQSKSNIDDYDILDNDSKSKIKHKKQKKKYLKHITKEALIASVLFTILSLPTTNNIISLVFSNDTMIGFIKTLTFKLMLFLLVFIYIAKCF